MRPGAFGADPPITFSGSVAEEMFLTLLKRCAAPEEIANAQLLPDGRPFRRQFVIIL